MLHINSGLFKLPLGTSSQKGCALHDRNACPGLSLHPWLAFFLVLQAALDPRFCNTQTFDHFGFQDCICESLPISFKALDQTVPPVAAIRSGVRFSCTRPKRPKKDSPALERCCSTRGMLSNLKGFPGRAR